MNSRAPLRVSDLGVPALRTDVDNLARIRDHFNAGNRKVVAIDDDPTGTQTSSDASLITAWEPEDIDWLLQQPEDVGFILTNSRAGDAESAAAINRIIGERLRESADRNDLDLILVSRSDSTLRGHFPQEPAALAGGFGLAFHGTLIVPFFAEGGRITVDGIHYVDGADGLTPVGKTPFARDATFGFQSSDLRSWVEEKTSGKIRREDVGAISLRMLRDQGPDRVAQYLASRHVGGVCVVDAIDYRDLEVLVVALQSEAAAGRNWINRAAAGIVPVLAGRTASPPVDVPRRQDTEVGGLIVAGSHVPQTTRQLTALQERVGCEHIVVGARSLLDSNPAEEIDRARTAASSALQSGKTTLLSTSRDVLIGIDPIETSRRIAEGLCSIVSGLFVRPSYVVAKGGITSHTLAVDALDTRRARVKGPIIPGVPMWQLSEVSRFSNLPFVVFPGNVGDDGALADVVDRLEGRAE